MRFGNTDLGGELGNKIVLFATKNFLPRIHEVNGLILLWLSSFTRQVLVYLITYVSHSGLASSVGATCL